ncbi:TIM barrel protein [Micromonospora deserti]|uniref:2-keto-myo-inositol dehydratase n=1 Tax=Micromonospora deserti TaxID=2070366 RepID=A0A2W2DA45_9ACTN|nr:TIM barrel protein [Micromonospora deserti]PZG02195.1 2-keto-myo-inositol dehydratase [Micromonospora deserti]
MTKPVMIGSAPDSWGVWFSDDSQQTPWGRFLDEVAAAGYTRIELGPYGYLPTDPVRLRDELDQRGLAMTAGTIFEHLHRADSWDTTWRDVSAAASLTAAMGAEHLVVIPDFWRDPQTGAVIEDPQLTDEQWPAYAARMNRLARQVREEFGLRIQFHPHADTHVDTHANVERFLHATDPDLVSLCLDTGHIAYCGGDSLKLIHDYPERIGYVHLKQVDPAILAKAQTEGAGFGEAVRMGVMCEPPNGIPEMPPILDALSKLDVEIFAIVEQDMYPCPPDQPLPIATRTLAYLRSCGLLR